MSSNKGDEQEPEQKDSSENVDGDGDGNGDGDNDNRDFSNNSFVKGWGKYGPRGNWGHLW